MTDPTVAETCRVLREMREENAPPPPGKVMTVAAGYDHKMAERHAALTDALTRLERLGGLREAVQELKADAERRWQLAPEVGTAPELWEVKAYAAVLALLACVEAAPPPIVARGSFLGFGEHYSLTLNEMRAVRDAYARACAALTRVEAMPEALAGENRTHAVPDPGSDSQPVAIHPVKQRGDSDCFNACLASLTDIPLDQFPTWTMADQDETGQWNTLLTFVRERGWDMLMTWRPIASVCVAHGRSPRGDWDHSVLYRNGMPWFDPHSSDAFLADAPESYTVVLALARPTREPERYVVQREADTSKGDRMQEFRAAPPPTGGPKGDSDGG